MTDDELRDDFGDELVEALRVRSRDATEAEVGVVVHPRARRVRIRHVLTAVLAAALATTGIVIVATSRRTPTAIHVAKNPPSDTTTTTTTQHGFQPLTTGVADWTWVNDEHGWALVRKPCGTTVCFTLRETTNGGRTWHSLPSPEAVDASAQADQSVACAAQSCISRVRFATPQFGWLFGPDLFETDDGGHTWTHMPGDPVLAVEAASGLAMRVTTTPRTYRDCQSRCTNSLDRKQLGASVWQRLPGSASPILLLQGKDIYDVRTPNFAGAGLASIGLSSDRGTTWTTIGDPCYQAHNGRTAAASAAPGGVLVVLCFSIQDSSASVQISTNRGKTFGPRRAIPGGRVDDAVPIAAASADTIAVAYRDQQNHGVLVSHDGGLTWRPTLVRPSTSAEDGFNPSLGWEDARTARVSFTTKMIWTTRDGGDTWTEDRVTP